MRVRQKRQTVLEDKRKASGGRSRSSKPPDVLSLNWSPFSLMSKRDPLQLAAPARVCPPAPAKSPSPQP
jgi:hypothetical protein